MSSRRIAALVLFIGTALLLTVVHQSKTKKVVPEIPLGQNAKETSEQTAGQTASDQSDAANSKSGSATAANAVDQVKPAEPAKNCFAFEYQHRKEDQNRDIEDFLEFSNAFPVLDGVNEKSICVKVNQKPVAFKLLHKDAKPEVMIGAVVGPESVIRVAYCLGKAPCKESCEVKSNAFMDDLMSDNEAGDSFKDSWGDDSQGAAQEQKKNLKEKVKEVRSIASASDLNNSQVMRTWNTLQKQEWVCKK